MRKIPVVDIFAGPGGLSEGFSRIHRDGERLFRIGLSVESEDEPFQTLRLRAFCRQFPEGKLPCEYYYFLQGEIGLDELFSRWPEQAEMASRETWQATLGKCEYTELDRKITDATGGDNCWVLIGGPPCQAYSCAGIVGNRTKKNYLPEKDTRYRLYKEYIRVLAAHSPAAFILENVPGMLSARLGPKYVIEEIINGLANPGDFALREFSLWPEAPRYRLFSLTSGFRPVDGDPRAFLVRAEDFGIPQSRRRIVIIGIRDDIDPSGFESPEQQLPTGMEAVLGDLPNLRSALSREPDSLQAWRGIFKGLGEEQWVEEVKQVHGKRLASQILACARELMKSSPTEKGADFIPWESAPAWNDGWFVDPRIGGICHHEVRPHIRRDLYRYLFCACFARNMGKSPKLTDFPPSLLPNHQNRDSGSFKDRFRVILPGRPAGTVISHLSKDGHAYIHPDPLQCRSLTPREAARLQTFPDNYYFFGGRASKFRQIGNAVPPWLARLIAESLVPILCP